MIDENKRWQWIDFMKAIAMIAVIMDHNYGVLYKNQGIQWLTFFSVTAFVFLSGITSAISIHRRAEIDWRYSLNRIKSIALPYFWGTLIYYLAQNNGSFSLLPFLNQLCTFSVVIPFYFFPFFLQLILAAPFLYRVLSGKSTITRIVFLILLYFVGNWLSVHTTIGSIYGGGGKLLGGSYLFVFSFGMALYFYLPQLLRRTPLFFIAGIAWVSLAVFGQNHSFMSSLLSNPPNWQLMVYSLAVTAGLFSIYNLVIAQIHWLSPIFRLFNLIGKNSLYVFIYHLLFMDLAYKAAQTLPLFSNLWVLRIWVLTMAVAGPVLLAEVWNRIRKINIGQGFDGIDKKLSRIENKFFG